MSSVALWFPGEEAPINTMVAIGPFQTNILGMAALKGRQWHDTQGKSWSFGIPQVRQLTETSWAEVRLLQTAPALPPSKITNVKPYPLPLGAREGIAPVAEDLKQQGILVFTHSPYNSPVWPVRNPNGKWRLTIDYRRLNANTGPLTAAVPNIAELLAAIQEQAHPILATIDVKDMFFMVLLQECDRDQFAFTREGQQYTFTHLPQAYKHSPTLAHHAPAQELAIIPSEREVKVYQYIDDILKGGHTIASVQTMQDRTINHLEGTGLQIPKEKIQAPAVKLSCGASGGKEGQPVFVRTPSQR